MHDSQPNPGTSSTTTTTGAAAGTADGAAAAEAAPGAADSAAPRPASDLDQLRDLAQRIKQALEASRWQELAELVALPQVWAFDRPVPLAEAIAMLQEVLADARDQHFYIERILRSRLDGDRGHLTLNGCLMWGEEGNWKEHEFEVDVHLGYERSGTGAWRLGYLGVTPGTPEEIPFPADEEDDAQGEALDGAEAKGGSEEPAVGALPQAATRSVADAPRAPGALPAGALALGGPGAAAEPPPGHVVAWLPVYLPAGAVGRAPAAPGED